MMGNAGNAGVRQRINWRAIGWSMPVLLLLLPLVTNAPWSLFDYIFMGALLSGVGLVLELVVRASPSIHYRAAAGVALAATFFLIVINGAVGIIGTEDDPANLMFLAVLGVGVIGTLIAKARPKGMVRALMATAVAHSLVAVVALCAELGAAEPPGRWGILLLNGFFVALWLGSAWLFQKSAQQQSPGSPVF